jgi:hypothetical protein
MSDETAELGLDEIAAALAALRWQRANLIRRLTINQFANHAGGSVWRDLIECQAAMEIVEAVARADALAGVLLGRRDDLAPRGQPPEEKTPPSAGG